VDADIGKFRGNLELSGRRERDTRRLFAVTQGGVKKADSFSE